MDEEKITFKVAMALLTVAFEIERQHHTLHNFKMVRNPMSYTKPHSATLTTTFIIVN